PRHHAARRLNLTASNLKLPCGLHRMLSLLQAFYSIRSERQLVERIDYDLLFRWFVGLGIEDAVWDATTFTKNRDRLLEGDMAAQFLAAVLSQDKVKGSLSSEHFSVDGTLLKA